MTRSVFIGIPAYTGQVHLPTMKCLIADIMPLATRGDSVRLHGIAENPIINVMFGRCWSRIFSLAIAPNSCSSIVT
jgi:hypothetical protein